MVRTLAVALFLFLSTATVGAEFQVGDRVFWKDGARGSDGFQEIGLERFAFPSTVREIRNDFLFLGAGWINRNDALSTEEALAYFSERVEQHPE
jgi:hypothetical protein